MLIHTPSTLLQVLGTQFDVEANMASTVLNVTEGTVRVRRLSDGREIDVPAKHRVIAEGGGDLTLQTDSRVGESLEESASPAAWKLWKMVAGNARAGSCPESDPLRSSKRPQRDAVSAG